MKIKKKIIDPIPNLKTILYNLLPFVNACEVRHTFLMKIQEPEHILLRP